jgi:hypothetical protein
LLVWLNLTKKKGRRLRTQVNNNHCLMNYSGPTM